MSYTAVIRHIEKILNTIKLAVTRGLTTGADM